MKRLLVLLCVLAFLVALPLSHIAMAEPPSKVRICHAPSAKDEHARSEEDVFFVETEGPLEGMYFSYGTLLHVPADAVEVHMAHGDPYVYYSYDEATCFPEWVLAVYGEVLTDSGLILTFRHDLPEPADGSIDNGCVYFWGEAI